jgi:hypothetical protein
MNAVIIRGLLFLVSAAASLSLMGCDTIFGLLNNNSDSRSNTQNSNTPGGNNGPLPGGGTGPVVDIVYNDSDPTDTALASKLATLLTTDLTAVSGVTGTNPAFYVAPVAQSSIPTNFSTTYVLTGKVIILTPGTSLALYPAVLESSVSAGSSEFGQISQEKNLVNQKGAIIAMGWETTSPTVISDAIFDDIIANTAWLHSGETIPTGLGFGTGNTSTNETSATPVSGVTVWSSPLSYTGITSAGSNPIALYSIGQKEQLLNLGSIATRYATEPSNSNFSAISQQGRFLQYGFAGIPDLIAGKVLFQNLVFMMTSFALP